MAAEAAEPTVGTWSATGNPGTARVSHSATLLADGRVLVVGGLTPAGPAGAEVPTGSAEVYENGIWTRACPLAVPRARHTATLLRNGKVLVAGGLGGSGQTTDAGVSFVAQGSAELFDPNGVDPVSGCRGTWSATAPMADVRYSHTATMLGDGTVLVATGHAVGPYSTRLTYGAETYNPDTGLWTAAGRLVNAREGHVASLLPDGRVLVAGGDSIYFGDSVDTAEVYTPTSRTWALVSDMGFFRSFPTGTTLADGKFLVVGGTSSSLPSGGRTAEIYDPATGTWQRVADLAVDRKRAAATALADGRVLVTGGTGAAAEVFNPVKNTWTSAGTMLAPRTDHTLTLLPNKSVLAVGGSAAELYFPFPCTTLAPKVAGRDGGPPAPGVPGFGVLDGALGLSAWVTAATRKRDDGRARPPGKKPTDRTWRRRALEGGFTLVELLVVVVILGILAAVVVFALRSAGDKGRANAAATDTRIVQTAQEAYCAQAGQYGSVDQLTGMRPALNGQTYKFLSDAPTYTSVEATDGKVEPPLGPCNGWRYSVAAIEPGSTTTTTTTTPPPTTCP